MCKLVGAIGLSFLECLIHLEKMSCFDSQLHFCLLQPGLRGSKPPPVSIYLSEDYLLVTFHCLRSVQRKKNGWDESSWTAVQPMAGLGTDVSVWMADVGGVLDWFFSPWDFDLIFLSNHKCVLDSVWTMMLLRFYATK